MSEKYMNYTAREIAALVKNRELSAVEVCREYLARAAADDTNAYITLMREEALAFAEETDRRIADGEASTLPLAGVPVSIKDNICTAGVRTTCASAMLENFVPSYSATAYAKLVKAGAVPVGKTNLDEFAVGGDGTTSFFGACRNPLDHERTPGGSSSGAGASVAGGSALLALGSDTGGSARVPASFCGICALKPTYGAVSRFGLVGMAPSLEQICPMSRDVQDNKLLFDVIRGADPLDMTTAELIYSDKNERIRGLRVGVFLPDDAAEYIKNSVENAARQLTEAGAVSDSVTLPEQENIVRVYYTLSSSQASSNLARFDGIRYGHRAADGEVLTARTEGFGVKLRERIAEGVYSLTYNGGSPYVRALELQREVRTAMDFILSRFDIILSPVTDTHATRPGEGKYIGDRYTVYANLTGLPAIAVPCGKSELGLPVGVQLMAKHGREDVLYSAAEIIERGTLG